MKVTLPPEILECIRDALNAIDTDIQERIQAGKTFADLEEIRREVLEMKSGNRKTSSPETSRMIIDSMDWDQPCLEKFYRVRDLLRKHYGLGDT